MKDSLAGKELILTHNSIVRSALPVGRLVVGALTKSLSPWVRNASATSPCWKVTPLLSVPLLDPARSVASPSPVHQLRTPAGTGTALGTVRHSGRSTWGRA